MAVLTLHTNFILHFLNICPGPVKFSCINKNPMVSGIPKPFFGSGLVCWRFYLSLLVENVA